MENCGLIAGIFLFIIFVIYVRVVGNEDGQFVSTYMGKEILIAHDFFYPADNKIHRQMSNFDKFQLVIEHIF